MEKNKYTFKDLVQKYNWNIDSHNISTIERKMIYAYKQGVIIELAEDKIQNKNSFYIIQDGLKLFTFKELCERYNWSSKNSKATRLKAAAIKGVILKEHPHCLYEIIEDYSEDVYTWDEIMKKYNWTKAVANGVMKKIEYAKTRGVIIEYTGNSNRLSYYHIVEDNTIPGEWVSNDKYPDLEFNRNGFIRNKISKRVYSNNPSTDGYVAIRTDKYIGKAHRLLMEVFKPIENMNDYYVDHINGKKWDNRIENLRWATPAQNNIYKQENWEAIYNCINKLIGKYGYQQVQIWINELLEEKI